MEIKIDKSLIEEGFKDHLKNNRGKYTTGVGATALGGIAAAGHGLLGVDAQDAVHDKSAEAIIDLNRSAFSDTAEAKTSATLNVIKRPDNTFGPPGIKNTIDYQEYLEPGTYTAPVKHTIKNAIAGATGLHNTDEQVNYSIRHPLEASKFAGKTADSTLSGLGRGIVKQL